MVRGECQGWVLSALSFQGRNTPWGNGIRSAWSEIIFFRIFYYWYWYFRFAEQGLPRRTTKLFENRLRL